MIRSVISKIKKVLKEEKTFDKGLFKNNVSSFENQKIKKHDLLTRIFDDKNLFNFPLNKVGVKEKSKNIIIEDIFDENKKKKVIADLEILCYLPSFEKKLEVDFIEQAENFLNKAGLKIETYSQRFLEYLADLNPSLSCELKIKFNYERWVKNRSFIKPLRENLKICLISKFEDKKILNFYGLGVDFIFNCQSFSKEFLRDFLDFSKEFNLSKDLTEKIISRYLITGHFNLGKLFLIIEDLNENLSFKDLYKIVDNSVVVLKETYNSKDEFKFLKESMNNKFLLEDISRQLIANIFSFLKEKLNYKAKILLNLDSFNTFHSKSFKINISTTFEKILKYI